MSEQKLTFDTIAEIGKTHPYYHIAVEDGLKRTTCTPLGLGVSDEPITHQFILGVRPSIELVVEPLTPEELEKMEEIDLSRSIFTGNWTNEIVRKKPVDGVRVIASYPNHKEEYVGLRHSGEKLDVFIVPLDRNDLEKTDGKALRGGFMLEFDYSSGLKDRKLLTY